MIFDIDVSGEDLLSKDYTICISNNENITRGFKFSKTLVNKINRSAKISYRFNYTDRGRANLKVRIYCIIIYYLFKEIKPIIKNNKIELNICKDFTGKDIIIKQNLNYFLIECLKLNLNIENIFFCKLDKNSLAHKFSRVMRLDRYNLQKSYIKLNLSEIEKYLIKN